MGKLHHSYPLPINIDQAIKIYPVLDYAAKNLEYHLHGYKESDQIFWQTLSNLFTGSDELVPLNDRIWSILINLRDYAKHDNLIAEPLLRFEHNNDRENLARDMPAMILKR
ncbi:hypothetical protein C4J81_10540 [Deltaproteobacteria bacterium Smac51]|nr:hypothetical protein C4J81_10540 [Deltaproteobacteria bacterium Smac51]